MPFEARSMRSHLIIVAVVLLPNSEISLFWFNGVPQELFSSSSQQFFSTTKMTLASLTQSAKPQATDKSTNIWPKSSWVSGCAPWSIMSNKTSVETTYPNRISLHKSTLGVLTITISWILKQHVYTCAFTCAYIHTYTCRCTALIHTHISMVTGYGYMVSVGWFKGKCHTKPCTASKNIGLIQFWDLCMNATRTCYIHINT